MLSFTKYIVESTGKPSSDTAGKLHELLVGYHLQNGVHMAQHPDKEGDTPKQVHDKLKASIGVDDYHNISAKAKSAADDLRHIAEAGGHKIHSVSWTSKPGDLYRATGIHATQKQDASDIVIHTKNGRGTVKHHGVSLKVSNNATPNLPIANPGLESTGGGEKLLAAHRAAIQRAYPKIASPPAVRRALMKTNAKMSKDIRDANTKTLNKITEHMKKHLESITLSQLSHHVRHHVLAADPTPMQLQGHNHIRHTTYEHKTGYQHHSFTPSESHNHILNDPKNITMHRSGTSVIFSHNGNAFARHRLKFMSQSDPLSGIKGSTAFAGSGH